MKKLIVSLGVALLLSLAGCNKDNLPADIEYACNVSFDALTVAEKQRFLQSQGKWKIEARFRPALYGEGNYYPPGNEKAFDFIGKDTLRLFTDSGVRKYKIQWWSDGTVTLFGADGSAQIDFSMQGISNYRLQIEIPASNGDQQFYCCIPERMIPKAPKLEISDNEPLDGLTDRQIMDRLIGTKWRVWLTCPYPKNCMETDPDKDFTYEFIGTKTLRIIRDSVVNDYEIGELYETTFSRMTLGFLVSYPYETLKEAEPYYGSAVLSDIYSKKMVISVAMAGCYILGPPSDHLVLVE